MSDDSASDPFAPPAVSTEVCCIHCGETYDSWQIEWRIEKTPRGDEHGFWCCPIPGCDGKGFGFDILPTDPNYRDENGGWVQFDDDDEDLDDEEWLDEDDEELSSHILPFAESSQAGSISEDDLPWDDSESASSSDRPADDWPFSMN